VVTVRPFNTFGPRQSSRAIVPTILGQLAGGAPRLRLGSLDPVRDLNFVSDTVAGFVHLATAEGVVGEEFNLGSGVGVSVGELAGRAMAVAGRELPIDCETTRLRPTKSEVMALVCDSARARATGWRPRVDLDEGLRLTWVHISANPSAVRTAEFRA